MRSRGLLVTALLASIALLGACSKQSDVSLMGHWQAERVSVYSAKLPIGPDIVVKEDRISNPSTGIDLPIEGIERKGDEATVNFDYGLGVTFYFDGPNRVHIDAPLIGKVYYRRVNDAVAASAIQAATGASSVSTAAAAQPAASTSTVNAEAAVQKPVATVSPVIPTAAEVPVQQGAPASLSRTDSPVSASDTDFQKALAAARLDQHDQALDYLNAALRSGFRDFGRLDAAPEFADLRSDVRYQALIGRYR